MTRRPLALAAALVLLPPLLARPAAAQGEGWNAPRALELIARARDRRSLTLADTGMVDYQADARGFVYFYLDRRDTGERTLVKTDQVALDVMWRAPDMAKQRIVGLRDQRTLPTTIQYHEDHLSVVMDNFGDLIRLGDGDEVRDVLHPAAPQGPSVYDFRLSDSLAVRLPGAAEPVFVYELEVRPRDPTRPALVGSVFVDRRAGDIVRMSFTFTAPSYVDRYLDYINVSLESGLWKGRFWLPNRQQVEIRRQLPELGFPAGGVIRGTMRISNYRFNQGLSPLLFRGRQVVSVPNDQRRAFPFEQGIHEELREEGLGPDTELGDVRREAARLMGRRMLSGLPATRLDVATASSVLRYDRAEGAAVGAGVRLHRGGSLSVGLGAGFAFGPEHPTASLHLSRIVPGSRIDAAAYLNRPRDVGVGPAASGAMNTVTAALAGRDYTDLFYAGGAEVRAQRGVGAGWTGSATLRAEDQRSARLEADASLFGGSGHFRPVSQVDEGTHLGLLLAVERRAPSGAARGWSARAGVEGATLRGDGGSLEFVRPRLDVGWARRWAPADASLEADLSAGAAFGRVPAQELWLLGGRGTVPGFPFRAYGGDRFGLARTTLSADVVRPWIRGRVLGAAGWTDAGDSGRAALSRWGAARETPRPRASVGAGLGLFYDILHVDAHRGLGADGRWEVVVEARTSFWDFL